MARAIRKAAIRRNRLAVAVAAALLPFAHGTQAQTAANTLPTGGQVTAGTATISQPSANKLQIDQASGKAILHWDSFSIGSSAWVNFTQPSASAIALNRVVGTNPSEIFGRLSANGQVFLSNPNGVLFAPGASVDVGGLFATTLSIADADFLAGRYNFYNAGGAGSAVNQGIITASGYAALAGPQVRNDGIIVAQSGTVALAAGDRVSLDMIGDRLISVSVDQAAMNASAINAGTLQADGGRVLLTARSANALLDTVINNTGIVRANSLVERNGEIVLDGGSAGVVANTGTLQAAGVDAGTRGGAINVTGDKVSVADGGVVDASGDSGGGAVAIGRGASATFIGADTTIRADATRGGSGGSVETSGGSLQINSAPQLGAGGSWLIDPFNIQIVAGTGTVNNTGAPNFAPNGNGSQIGATLIVNQLNAGANVVVETGAAGSPGAQLGDLTVSAPVTKGSVNTAGLTLNAANNLAVNAPISLNAGAFRASAGHDMTVTSTVTASNMAVTVSGALTLDGGGLQDAQLNSSGGQMISASALTLRGQNNRRAVIQNTVGDQNVTIGAGGIDLNVLGGSGVAQIASNNPNSTTFTAGAQTVSTTGALNVVGGSTTTGSRNSGVFQNQTGKQTVTAAAISLQAAATANAQAGASISTNGAQNGGGADQEVNVAAGTITVAGGGIGLTNRASIVSSRNQTINGNADIIVTGGSSGTGTNAAGTNNQASISANNGTQTIAAHNITLRAGIGGTDTSATVTGATQRITATDDVSINGGANAGDSNGARIGASGTTTTGTDLQLAAHDVILTGGGTDSGAAIGNSSAAVGKPNAITITASGKVEVNSGAGNGARIGAPKDDTGGGSIKITATGNIALNGGAHDASIRTADDVTLNAASITETSNGQVLANSLALTAGGIADLGGSNQISAFSGTSGGAMILANSGNLAVTGISAGGTLTLTNAGAVNMNASGTSDAIVSSVGGQTISADALLVHVQDGRLARIINNGGAQAIAVGAGGIDLEVVDGRGSAQIVNARGTVTNGAQDVSTSGLLNVVGGSTSNGSGAFNSGVFQAQTGKQTVSAGSIALQAAVAPVNTGGALIINTDGGSSSDQQVNVASGTIRLTGGGVGLNNRAAIQTSGNQTITGNADIFITGGNSGSGTNNLGTANPAFISANTAGKTQMISAHNITLQAGPGGTDTFAAILANKQTITATGDVQLTGGANSGDAAGARIGAPGNTATGTDLELTAHNVVVTGGTTTAAAIGNSTAAVGKPNTIKIIATNDVILNSGAGNGARIGSPNGDTGAGSISVTATGRIALNPDDATHASSIRSAGDVTLNAASISEAANGQILANSLALTTSGQANLGGSNQISSLSATTGGAMTLANTGALAVSGITAGGALTLTNSGALTLSAGGTHDAVVSSVGGQSIAADALTVHAQDGRLARIINASGSQTISTGAGGIDLTVLDGQGSAQIVNARGTGSNSGTQTVSTTGLLNVVGGSSAVTGAINSGVFQSQTGKQTVTAGSIELQAAVAAVNTGGALIINTDGGSSSDQEINVASGTLRLTGGGVGSNNRAAIQTNGNQTITGNADIFITGGSSGSGTNDLGTNNRAFISANTPGKTQTISAHDITLQAGPGGTDTFAVITSNTQTINATGDVRITGGANTGDSNGARIGGPGNTTTGTNLALSAHDVILTGGTTDSGAALGSSANSGSVPNTIRITATGDVVLNSGAGNGSRIGAPSGSSGGGNIEINATNIALNGAETATVIRTAGDVALHATGSISEASNGFVVANGLTTSSGGSTLLGGPNQISVFNATSGGDVLLDNTGALDVVGLTGARSSVTNAGPLTISGAWYSGGSVSITTTGSASNLLVTGNVFGSSDMNVAVSGGITVSPINPGFTAGLSAIGNQTIAAGSLAVTAHDAGDAFIMQSAPGAQSISINGGSIDVQTLAGGGNASISAGGAQTITVLNGDHFNVNGAGGSAAVFAMGGPQTIVLTGTGRNAMTVGSLGALGASDLVAGVQSITAGVGGETGSITIVGSQAPGTGLFTSVASGSSQTIATSGALALLGDTGFAQIIGSGGQQISAASLHLTASNFGNAVILNAGGDQHIATGVGGITLDGGSGSASIFNQPAFLPGTPPVGTQTVETAGALTLLGAASGSRGIFQNQTGTQTISAADISLHAADAGSNGTAFIVSSPGANQVIHSDGKINVTAGGGGLSNRAGITANGNQTINGNADILVTGGAGGSGSQATGTQNSASIAAVPGRTQTINARSITVSAGGGTDASATITGSLQAIDVSEDVRVNGSAGTGDVNGARIGGAGSGPTNLTLNARDVVLTAGATNGVGLGSSVLVVQPNTVNIHATRDVILNAGDAPGTGARIGSSRAGLAGGDISVEAGRDIALNGTAQLATIRTSGNVALQAGGSVTESGNGRIVANSLTVASGGATLLGGWDPALQVANQVSVFNATSGGEVLLDNNGALNVTGLSAVGNATLDNVGNVTLSGPWTAGGTSTITVHSDLLLSNLVKSQSVVLNATSGGIREEGAGAIEAQNLSTHSAGDTALGGANEVSVLSASSDTGSVSLANTGALAIASIDAPGGFALDNTGPVTLGAPISTTGTLAITVDGDLNLSQTIHAGSLSLTSSTGSITASDGVFVAADSITTHAAHDTALLGDNAVKSLSAVAAGDFRFRNTVSLSVLGLSATNAALMNVGDVHIDGAWTAALASSITASGPGASITEGALGGIASQSLSTKSEGATLLGGANALGSFTASAGGDVSLTNTSALLSLGSMTLPGGLAVRQAGDLAIGNAGALAPTAVMTAGPISLSSTGTTLVRGSDTTPGAGSYLLAGGLLDIHAGGFSLLGGAAPFAPAAAAGETVNVLTTGSLQLQGGRGGFSPALLLGGTGIDLTVGGTLSIDGNTSNGSVARVQTATRDGSIQITFTNESGDYVVDGLDGRIKHGEDGFYTGIKPAKPGETFFVTYE